MMCILAFLFASAIAANSISESLSVCFTIGLGSVMLDLLTSGDDTFNSLDLRRELNEIVRECSALQENQMEVMKLSFSLIVQSKDKWIFDEDVLTEINAANGLIAVAMDSILVFIDAKNSVSTLLVFYVGVLSFRSLSPY